MNDKDSKNILFAVGGITVFLVVVTMIQAPSVLNFFVAASFIPLGIVGVATTQYLQKKFPKSYNVLWFALFIGIWGWAALLILQKHFG